MTVSLRAAVASDQSAIRVCAEEAYAVYVPQIGRRPAPMDADFAAQIAANQVRVATGRRNRVIGYAVFCPDKDAMHLESLAVRPSAAGQGVGKALMDLCEVEARALGLKAVRLYTNAAMIPMPP